MVENLDNNYRNDESVPSEVSYLVPSFNHELFILDCLNSIAADAQTNDEIIIIDDGSTDGTARIIQHWFQSKADLKVRIKILFQKNSGVSVTLNRLIALSTGKFIRFVASDDLILAGGTRQMMDILTLNPQLLAVVADVRTIDEKGLVVSDSQIGFLGKNPADYAQDIRYAIISKWAICGPSILLRRGFEQFVGGYDEGLTIEDWSMYLRLAAQKKILFLNEKVADYRVHGTNTSRTSDVAKRIKNLESQLMAGKKAEALFHSPYSYFIKAEIFLLKAKIHYLQKKLFLCGMDLLCYGAYLLFGKAIYRLFPG